MLDDVTCELIVYDSGGLYYFVDTTSSGFAIKSAHREEYNELTFRAVAEIAQDLLMDSENTCAWVRYKFNFTEGTIERKKVLKCTDEYDYHNQPSFDRASRENYGKIPRSNISEFPNS